MGIHRLNPGQGNVARLNQRVGAEAVADWWLSGGIAAANCIVAYQPKGAADYATSKVNLANPGTLNLTDPTNYPAWSASNGWDYGTSNTTPITFLRMGGTTLRSVAFLVYPVYRTNAQSIFGRINNDAGEALIRTASISTFTDVTDSRAFHYNGSLYVDGVETTTYTNQAWQVVISIGGADRSFDFTIGYGNDALRVRQFNRYIAAMAGYNHVLTTEQVTALTTAMNLL